MADACPVRTPEERKASDIVCKAQDAMMETVHAAVAEAVERVREHFLAAGLDHAPSSQEYFGAVVHHRMYLALCGAAVDTLDGGDPRKAIGLIRNQQSIANRYWHAGIEVTPPAR